MCSAASHLESPNRRTIANLPFHQQLLHHAILHRCNQHIQQTTQPQITQPCIQGCLSLLFLFLHINNHLKYFLSYLILSYPAPPPPPPAQSKSSPLGPLLDRSHDDAYASSADDNRGQPAYDEAKYAQYLENRAKHWDELDATYRSWQLAQTPQTLFKLALIHLTGSHPAYPRKAEIALSYFHLAAAQGHGEASAFIALFHVAGVLFPQSAATAYSILQARVQAGCAPSMFWLSLLHLRSPEAVIQATGLAHFVPYKVFLTALNNNLVNCFNPDKVQFAPTHNKALELLLRSAQLGCDRAQDLLSWCYFSGELVGQKLQSFAQAIHWATKFSQSADQMRFKNNGGVSLHLRDTLDYIHSARHVDHLEIEKLVQPACDEGSAHAWYISGLAMPPGLRSQFHFLKAAVRGSPEGQTLVGFYLLNQPVPNYPLAVHWLQLAADQGNCDAMCILGQMYADGIHFAQNYHKSLELYMKAAQLGNVSAQWHVARAYDKGVGLPKSTQSAVDWYTKVVHSSPDSIADAIKHVDPSRQAQRAKHIGIAQHRLGTLYLDDDAARGFPTYPATALKYLRLAAEGGFDIDYQTTFATLLSTLSTTSRLPKQFRDDVTAVKFFTAAANKNNADAQTLLAYHLIQGVGVDYDVPGAMAWWKKAKDQGSSQAAFELALFQYYGQYPHVIPQNKAEGLRLMTTMAENGDEAAQLELGDISRLSGAYPQSEKWLIKAAQSSAQGKHCLAELYHGTDYIPPTMTEKQVDLKIVNNYSAAAKGGHLLSNLRLGHMFLHGFRSIPQDLGKAVTFFAACLDEDPHVKDEPSEAATAACFYLGLLTQKGLCLHTHMTKLGFSAPLEWWTFGANHGDARCQSSLAEMYYEGTGGLKQDYALASHWLDQCLKQGHNQEAVALLGKMQHRGVFVRPPAESEEDE